MRRLTCQKSREKVALAAVSESREPIGPVIVCPLQFERKMLLRAGLDGRFPIECCGPGAEAVKAWAGSFRSTGRMVILAGLAGGLSETCPAGSAQVVDRVMDALTGEDWTPTSPDAGIDRPGTGSCVLVSTDAAVLTSRDKLALAERTGAQLVDLESAAFARSAVAAGWRWAVVRGVSDGWDTDLPRDIDLWIDGVGRARRGQVAAAIARRPWLMPSVLRLHHRSVEAMGEVARVILRFYGDWS